MSIESIRKLETRRERRTQLEEPPTREVPRFLQPLRGGTKSENDTVHLETRLEPVGDEHLTVEWTVNGHPLPASSRIATVFNFGYVCLSIKQLQPSDSGTYTCRAANVK